MPIPVLPSYSISQRMDRSRNLFERLDGLLNVVPRVLQLFVVCSSLTFASVLLLILVIKQATQIGFLTNTTNPLTFDRISPHRHDVVYGAGFKKVSWCYRRHDLKSFTWVVLCTTLCNTDGEEDLNV